MSRLPKLVVFDMAGTTLQDEGGQVNLCLREALHGAGVAATEADVNAVMGLPKPEAIRQLLICGTPERVEQIHSDFVTRITHYYRHDPRVQEVEGTSLVFVKLRQAGIKVALDTGFSRDIADVVISRLGWRPLLDDSITSDEVPRGRPYPDMVQALQARFGIAEPSQIAKIGDTPSDLQEGTSAGCGWVIGVTAGSHTHAELLPHPHTHLLSTIAALPALFGI